LFHKNNLKGNTLNAKTWLYLVFFSVVILGLVWLFQVGFLNTFYEWNKTNEMYSIAEEVKDKYVSGSYDDLETIAYTDNVCIEVTNGTNSVYSTSQFSHGCIVESGTTSYKTLFMQSGTDIKAYKLVNQRFNDNTLIYALKMSDGKYVYISSSLVPLDSTTSILTKQFSYVIAIVLLMSFAMAYWISNRISKPIVKLSNTAKKIGSGEKDVVFETDSDIVELNELAGTLNSAQKELSKTDELRRELLANVSHDLKTPLTMIQAYAEMARDLNSNNKKKRTENLNVIIDESKRLNLLVNDVVDLARMQSNVETLEYSHFNINNLIKTIISHYTYLNEKGYQFIFNYDKEYMVSADQKRIEQVLYNLINNAVNYVGEDKQVIINLKDNNKTVLIEVSDHGPGIEPKELNLIWDKYYKVDKKYRRNKVGTGIGLSIVKSILEKHHVKYGVNSKVGIGTTFYFELEKNN
jgi:signal transduction histidine kinase